MQSFKIMCLIAVYTPIVVWLEEKDICGVLELLFTCLVYYLFFRQFLGPVIGGALVQKVGFRSMPAVRLKWYWYQYVSAQATSVFCVCLTFNLHTQFLTIKYNILCMTLWIPSKGKVNIPSHFWWVKPLYNFLHPTKDFNWCLCEAPMHDWHIIVPIFYIS